MLFSFSMARSYLNSGCIITWSRSIFLILVVLLFRCISHCASREKFAYGVGSMYTATIFKYFKNFIFTVFPISILTFRLASEVASPVPTFGFHHYGGVFCTNAESLNSLFLSNEFKDF